MIDAGTAAAQRWFAGRIPARPWHGGLFRNQALRLSFSEALAEELIGTGVTWTALCPGPTAPISATFRTAKKMRSA